MARLDTLILDGSIETSRPAKRATYDFGQAVTNSHLRISFQGAPGAYSDLACRTVYPGAATVPCATFEDAFQAVHDKRADLAMIPVDNTLAGRVADIHHILPRGGLHIIGEHYQRINHALMGLKGASADGLTHVFSHVHALSQCRRLIRDRRLVAVVAGDTAGAAEEIAQRGNPAHAAIASTLAAEIYGLQIFQREVEDESHNTTRFLIMSPEAKQAAPGSGPIVTSFVFRVRNIPAALYKALGGFATNGVNMTKLESYLVDGHFTAAQFLVDVEGHPDDRPLKLALEELAFFAAEMRILGVYPAAQFRLDQGSI